MILTKISQNFLTSSQQNGAFVQISVESIWHVCFNKVYLTCTDSDQPVHFDGLYRGFAVSLASSRLQISGRF